VELERLCLAGDEDRARKLSDTIGAAWAHEAGAAALARYVFSQIAAPSQSGVSAWRRTRSCLLALGL
jgi:hypothetical protein